MAVAKMERIDSPIQKQVLAAFSQYNYMEYTSADVERVLSKERLDIEDFGILLSPAAKGSLEKMARKAQQLTRQYFGNSVALFTPLYISNYCENHCTYCGFNCKNKIKRGKLTLEEIERELQVIAETGLKEVLILSGESRAKCDLDYIGEAIKLAKKYFTTIGIEIYPLNTEEYAYIRKCGADFVSVYQETYNQSTYQEVHLSGPKSDYEYRFYAQERALLGGMRGVALGVLLGLDDFRKDAFAVGVHAYLLQQSYPHAEISFSVPRIRPYINQEEQHPKYVHTPQLLQVMLAYRIFLPFAGITISTREEAKFRDNVVGMVATKMSAGVKVGVGGHDEDQKGDEQFEISDDRSVADIHQMLYTRNLQPVYTDYINL